MLLTTQQRNRFATVSGTLALTLSINTIWRTFNPPKVLTPEQVAAMAAANSADTTFTVNWVSDNYLNVLLLKAGGAIGLFLIARWLYSGQRAVSLEPDPARPLPSPTLVTDDKEYIDYADAIAHEVAQWCREFPWLIKLLKANIIIVAGQPGTGKSSIMQTIAFLRFLLFQGSTEIYDPDADSNLAKGTWVHGTLIGQRQNGTFPAQFTTNFDELKGKDFAKRPTHTPIFDEVTKWITEDYMDVNGFKSFLTNIHQKFRRLNIKPILGLHSLSVEENTQEKSLPKFTSVRDYAAIIYLESDTDDFGDTKFSGLARIKEPGKRMTSDDLTLSKFPAIHITAEFSMSHLMQLLGPLLAYAQPTISDVTNIDASKSYRAAKSLFAKAHGSGSNGLATLNGRLHQTAIGDGLNPRSIRTAGQPQWGKVDKDLVRRMWEYLMDKTTPVSPDEDGFVRIRDLWRNWGSKQKLWADTEIFKSFLQKLHDSNIGTLGDGEWQFNETLDFS